MAMPLRPASAGTVKHQVYLLLSGEVMLITLWTHHTSMTVTAARIAEERTVINTWINTNWRSGLTTSISVTLIKSWNMSIVPPPKSTDFVPTGGVAGTTGGAYLPPALAVTVSLRTQPVGAGIRGINGHISDCGHVVANYQGSGVGVWLATNVSNRLTQYNALRTTLKEGVGGGVRGTWCIVSYQDGGARGAPVYRVVPLVLLVDHLLILDRIGLQRRRRPREQSFPIGS